MRHRWMGLAAAGVLLVAARTAAAGEASPAGAALSPKAEDALRLVASSDDYQRQTGFLRLEALRDSATVPAIRPYLSSKDPDIRAESLRAMAAIQAAEAVPLLLETLQRDRDARVRRAAILGIEPFAASDSAITPALLAALTDRDTTVRMTAVDVVSRLKDPRAREAILARNKREHRHDVRRVLKLAMKRLGAE